MKIEIPAHLLKNLGPEMKMDVHWVDVWLKDGRVYRKVVVRGGRYITGFANDDNGEGDIPFTGADIKDIRRESSLMYFFAKLGLFGRTR